MPSSKNSSARTSKRRWLLTGCSAMLALIMIIGLIIMAIHAY